MPISVLEGRPRRVESTAERGEIEVLCDFTRKTTSAFGESARTLRKPEMSEKIRSLNAVQCVLPRIGM